MAALGVADRDVITVGDYKSFHDILWLLNDVSRIFLLVGAHPFEWVRGGQRRDPFVGDQRRGFLK